MNYNDPFPATMPTLEFVQALDKLVKHPVITAADLVSEERRLQIAVDEGARDLVDKLLAWQARKEKP